MAKQTTVSIPANVLISTYLSLEDSEIDPWW